MNRVRDRRRWNKAGALRVPGTPPRRPIKPSLSMALIGLSMLVIAGAVLVGGVRGIIAALLALIAVPIAGFTYDQIALTRKGRSLATTVEEIQALKSSDQLAFTRPLTAIFRPVRGSSARESALEPTKTARNEATRHETAADVRRWAVLTSVSASGPTESTQPASAAGTGEPSRSGAHSPARPTVPAGRPAGGDGTTGTPGPDGRLPMTGPRPNFWQALTIEERQALRARAHEATYRPGDVLCREGRPAEHVIVIMSGWAKVWVHEPDGIRDIALRGPGDLVGERAALLVRARSAMVTAETEVGAFQTRTESFLEFITEYPRVQAVLERQVYDRLTEVPPRPAAPDHADVPVWAGSPVWEGTPLWAGPQGWAGPHGWPGQPVQPQAPAWSGGNCSILLTDIAGFGGHSRDDDDRMIVRDAMYVMLQDAFAGSGLGQPDYYQEDRGDGALIVVPPDTPTRSVVDPTLARLAALLRRHNRRASEATRLQLRIALHVGPVTWDPRGVSGTAIIQTARLLEAPVLKNRLAETGADLGFIASTFVYETVIQQGPGFVDPACYLPVEIQVKESALTGWMYLAGGSSLRAV
ncbi:Crp/Fnr family transcriptional regulator [Actinomadura rudentiformis]|uniref:Crp/Fnr family transcriptional regulator n=1 Tax=Actinomadura rudentiformis TaxID=359158 RepID=UPI00178C5DB9|nr:cyclic nucleotide-binding domain-containing protein [Actinomadura rudentiformis]